jgi:hypothetical protein
MSKIDSTLPVEELGVIYALARSSKPDAIRYVGKTTQPPERRIRQHLLKNDGRTAKDRWLSRLADDSDTVRLFVVESCRKSDLNEREIHWIAALKAAGHQLLNGTMGGDGGEKTPETRAKLSAALKGRKQTDEFRAKLSAINKGKTLSPEHRQKIAEALKGKTRPPETIEKMRAAAIGNNYRRMHLDKLSNGV